MKQSSLLSNFVWKFAERISAQLVSLIVSIVLARLLGPDDYGIVTIVMIFITFANVFVSDGFGKALIQKKDPTALDYCSVLYFNLLFSAILYFVLFFTAPLIARFYGSGYEILVPVLRVLALRLPLTAANSVQQAYVSKKMIFRKFFLSTLLGTLLSGIAGIGMAYSGFGVWSLVVQYLLGTIVSTVTLAFVLRKKPQLIFSLDALKNLVPFGVRVLGIGLLITGYQEIRALIVGKVYSSADLAYYDRGRQFPNLLVTNINTSIGAVLFPKMANEQDDIIKIRETMRNSIRFSSYVLSPAMLGLAAVSEPFVRLVLTDKWMSCVPLLQMFCVIYLFYPIHTTNMQAVNSIGRADVTMRLEIIKKIIELILLLCAMQISVKAIVISEVITATLFVFINAYPNTKFVKYSIKEQLSDILPNVSMALVMAVTVYMVNYFPIGDFLKLVIQVALGALLYLTLSIITRNKELKYIKSIMFNRFLNRRNL